MQARLELGHGRRQDEDRHDIDRHLFLQLLGALPVDVEQHVPAFTHRGFNRFARRTVVIPVHLRPFEQRVAVAQTFEFPLGNELVVHALDFTLAALASGDADRQADLLVLVHQRARNGGFPGAGRRGDDQHQAPPGDLDVCGRNVGHKLLQILNLFPELVDDDLEFYAGGGHRDGIRFGTDRI